MRTLVALVLLSVTLSPPFGEAEARAVEVGTDGLVLEVFVEVDTSALVVLARGVGRFDELAPVALTELSPGEWGGIVELPIVEDIRIGFELIRPDGGSALVSELHTLSELGVDPAVFGVAEAQTTTSAASSTDTTEASAASSGDEPSTAPIWLGVIAGAGALVLILVWWRGDRRQPELDGEGKDPGAAPAATADEGGDDSPEEA